VRIVQVTRAPDARQSKCVIMEIWIEPYVLMFNVISLAEERSFLRELETLLCK
jgi:hypothetical protein